MLRNMYSNVVAEYCKVFFVKHDFGEYDNDMWIGNDTGGVIEVCDMFIGFDEIRYDIDNKIESGVFEEWFDYSTEIDFEHDEPMINFPSWCKGMRPNSFRKPFRKT